MKTVRLAAPAFIAWAMGAFGINRWIRNRGLHAPEADAQILADQAGVTKEQWRRVEAVQAAYFTDGITVAAAQAAAKVQLPVSPVSPADLGQ